jgi:hypothetical protein
MAGFVIRKAQRLKTFTTVRYRGEKIAGEGIIKDLSVSGTNITGNKPVSVGMVLALKIFVPGEPELLSIEHATVKWAKRNTFGVDFDNPRPEVAERISQIVSILFKTQRVLSRER